MKQFGDFKSGLHLNQLDFTKACPFLCTFDINFIVLVCLNLISERKNVHKKVFANELLRKSCS